MENKKAQRLIKKYISGTANNIEKAVLESWYIKTTEQQVELPGEPDYQNIEIEILNTLRNQQLKQPRLLWPRLVAAASILAIIGAGLFYYTNKAQQNQVVSFHHHITPGSNKAILTLANGQKITLADSTQGNIAEQAGISINKTGKGEIIYTAAANNSKQDSSQYNMIETPKGGKYQVNLADGTKVWLNAASTLKFPASFSNVKFRRVELTGEGYFEVAKNKEVPFIVKTANQEVKVLGTHFNINSYADEPNSKTTLLEGSVLVNSNTMLAPGQQCVTTGPELKVSEADTELAIAWKNNKFMFDNEHIESIMRKVARWYNVDVIYQDNIPDERFGGSVSRFDNISTVLNMLQVTGNVHFKIDGRRITVTK
jgi:transmembrane sensor